AVGDGQIAADSFFESNRLSRLLIEHEDAFAAVAADRPKNPIAHQSAAAKRLQLTAIGRVHPVAKIASRRRVDGANTRPRRVGCEDQTPLGHAEQLIDLQGSVFPNSPSCFRIEAKNALAIERRYVEPG